MSFKSGEETKPVAIPMFKERYVVSTLGNVYSLYGNRGWRKEPRMMKASLYNNGYYYVTICTNIKGKTVDQAHAVHRLVCGAFHGDRPSSRHQVAHLNGKPTDNRAENLAWVTPQENEFHKKLHGTRLTRMRNHEAKLNQNMVDAIRKLYADKILSQEKLAYYFGVTQSTIWSYLK